MHRIVVLVCLQVAPNNLRNYSIRFRYFFGGGTPYTHGADKVLPVNCPSWGVAAGPPAPVCVCVCLTVYNHPPHNFSPLCVVGIAE